MDLVSVLFVPSPEKPAPPVANLTDPPALPLVPALQPLFPPTTPLFVV